MVEPLKACSDLAPSAIKPSCREADNIRESLRDARKRSHREWSKEESLLSCSSLHAGCRLFVATTLVTVFLLSRR